MKKILQYLDDKLLHYIDGSLNAVDRQSLEAELKLNEALKERLDQLEDINLSMRNTKLEQPSKNFTHLVMTKLDQYPLGTPGFSIRGGILLLAGVLAAVSIAAILVSAGAFDNAMMTIDLNELEFPKEYFERTLPSIPFNVKLVVNFIIILNLGLAWLVLDRAILKPLFQRRMQGGH